MWLSPQNFNISYLGSGNRTAKGDITVNNNIIKNISVTDSTNTSSSNADPTSDATDAKDIENNQDKSLEVTIPISIATE